MSIAEIPRMIFDSVPRGMPLISERRPWVTLRRAAAARRNVTQGRLSEMSGIPLGTLSKIMRGISAIDVEQLFVLCTALGVDPVELMTTAERQADDSHTQSEQSQRAAGTASGGAPTRGAGNVRTIRPDVSDTDASLRAVAYETDSDPDVEVEEQQRDV